MRTLPLNLVLEGREAALVGGDDRALPKAEALLEVGSRLKLYSDAPQPALAALAQGGPAQLLPLSAVGRGDSPAVIVVGWEGGGEREAREALIRLARQWSAPLNAIDLPATSDFYFPAIVRRGDVRVAVTTGGLAPTLARLLRTRIEAILPDGLEYLAQLLAETGKQLRRRGLAAGQRSAVLTQIAEGAAGAAATSGRMEQARRLAEPLLAGAEGRGAIYMVGAGPGNPGLLTLRGLQLLQRSEIVLYDRLVSDEVLAMAGAEARKILVGKAPGDHSVPQAEINRQMIELAREGRQVCRLKGGDPFIFGRGGEELEEVLAQGIALEVVPGINAASGCAAWAGIPLTHRDHAHSCMFLTAHGVPESRPPDWQRLLAKDCTLVIFMPLARLAEISRQCLAAGVAADWPVALVQSGTLPEQRVLSSTIGAVAKDAEAAAFGSPAILICGEVTRLRQDLNWYAAGSENPAATSQPQS